MRAVARIDMTIGGQPARSIKHLCFWRWFFVGSCCSAMLFLVNPVSAENSAAEWRATVMKHLDREGYLGDFRNGQGLQRGISAYLWDNRHALETLEIPRQQEFDALICLLFKKGYPGFETLVKNPDFHRRCEKTTK